MNKEERLLVKASLEEIEATIKLVKKPMFRKTYLTAMKWYKFHKERIMSFKYRGKIERLPKHRLKKEEVINE